jgi:hypothetical protein
MHKRAQHQFTNPFIHEKPAAKLFILLSLHVPLGNLAQDTLVKLLILISQQTKQVVEEIIDLVFVLLIEDRKCVNTNKPCVPGNPTSL